VVVVEDMLTSAALSLLVLPILYGLALSMERRGDEGTRIAVTTYRKGLPVNTVSKG
jgi:hypothetical protein